MNTTIEVLGYAREIAWLPWAVQYFFLIGISVSAFFLSLPGLILGRNEWRPISRRALLVALVGGMTAPVALLADLHQPGRFLNFYLYPNFNSWMARGAFFIPLYLLGLFLYAWVSLRPHLAAMERRCVPGTSLAALYRLAAYGGHANIRAARIAAAVAALGGILVLVYTGMEVMVLRSRSLWNTPVLPLLFAVSALGGGLGMTSLFEAMSRKRASAPLLNRWIAGSQWATLALLTVWLLSGVTGLSATAADVVAATRHSFGWALTCAWLFGTTIVTLWLARTRRDSLILTGLLAVQGAWLVRWIMFIGGQGIPKIGATFSMYFLNMSPDSVLGMLGTSGLFLFIYIFLNSFIPWDEQAVA